MCGTLQTFHYSCGHSHSQLGRDRTFCLFANRGHACADTGIRQLTYNEEQACMECRARAHFSAPRPRQPRLSPAAVEHHVRRTLGRARLPARNAEAEAARENRRNAPKMVGSIGKHRVAELNALAKRTLGDYAGDDLCGAPEFDWLVRLVASLPTWIDRKGLMAELGGWAAVFGEGERAELLKTASDLGWAQVFGDALGKETGKKTLN
ncbi:hypothetical protein F5B20DRAFT_585363 [Whalleya microplaca]|nr:hypothetical protein F5B20DRAFT_585363 [Whalleya microplaca]